MIIFLILQGFLGGELANMLQSRDGATAHKQCPGTQMFE